MKLTFFIILLTLSKAYSFYLITNNGSHFKSSSVKVYITENSSCLNTGYTKEDFLDLAISGAKSTWNRVHSANITIKKGGILKTTDMRFINEELCLADSSTTCSPTNIPKVRNIVIACNDNAINFPSANILAISGPNNISKNEIRGSMILINNTNDSTLETYSKKEIENILAHEIGHAIGIGHSKDQKALMHHSQINTKNKLSQDDIDALTYLYPYSINDISCSSIISSIDTNQNDKRNNFIILGLSFLLTCLLLNHFQSSKN